MRGNKAPYMYATTQQKNPSFGESSTSTRRVVETIHPELVSLIRVSARIGSDPLLVQASSGNTSVKLDGVLWIKASGKWLEYADREDILVPLRLSECFECLEEGIALPPVASDSCSSDLAPSIETFMHAILPQRVVVHVHSVNTIAWAVRSDALLPLSKRLSGLRWQWIPYALSGRPLAREIQIASTRRPDTDVFILGNHGLVICADDCEKAAALLFEVDRRLATQPRSAPKPKLDQLEKVASYSPFGLPNAPALHALGTDRRAQRIAKRGVLYPCQAIFLGETLPLIPFSRSIFELRDRIHSAHQSPFVAIERAGILINKKITAAQYATLTGFIEVLRRIGTSSAIRYLTADELVEVSAAGATGYRRSAENATRFSRA